MIKIGQKVHCILYGGKDGYVYRIDGEQNPDSVKSMGGGVAMTGGNATFHIVWEYGGRTNVPECIIHGVQWSLYDEVIEQAEIDMWLANADEHDAKEKEKAEKFAAEQEAKRTEYRQLAVKEGMTTADNTTKRGGVLACINIRVILKKHFPGQKFSVTSKDSINIKWDDGPTTDEVEALVKCFQLGTFNGMEDIYEYSNDRAWTDVFGGDRFVFVNREVTPEQQVAICQAAGVECPAIVDSNHREWYNAVGQMDDQGRRIRETVSKTSLYVKPEKPVRSKPVPAGQLSVELKYNTEKCGIELYFSGKPDADVRHKMKAAGMKWSKFNKCWYVKSTPDTETFCEKFVEEINA